MHRAARSSLVVWLLAGCGDDTVQQPTAVTLTASEPETTDAGSTGTTTGAPPLTTGDAPTTTTTTDTSTGGTTAATTTDPTTGPVDPTTPVTTGTSTGDTDTSGDPSTGSTGDTGTTDDTGGCTPGEVGCVCDADDECVPEGTCWGGVCEKNGGNLCPYEFDNNCDEGNGICPPGSDPHDCCATQNNGVCEEAGMGGECPVGTDSFDCGGCQWLNDGVCDEPFLCPLGSDKPDCCATEENGVCEEISMGGMCPDGSDSFDCGTCEWVNDGWCDEPDLCPEGTDTADCCATEENGVCEEIDQGGMCPEGSDPWDCGFCQWTNDGECDEPNLCPPGSDVDDCA